MLLYIRGAAYHLHFEFTHTVTAVSYFAWGRERNLPHFAWGLGKVSQSAWGIGHSGPLCLGHQTFCPTLPGATFVAWPTLPGAQKCAYFAWGNTHFAPLCLGHPGGAVEAPEAK